jgi:hypothetical protein
MKVLIRFWDGDSSTEGSEGTGDEDKTAGEQHDGICFLFSLSVQMMIINQTKVCIILKLEAASFKVVK